MSKSRGKRPGLRARSKNARKASPKVKKVARREQFLREHLEAFIAQSPWLMRFRDVQAGAPDEGQLVLVRLTDNTFRFGMVLKGRFANYEYHNEEFVTFAHPERITHWMRVHPPVPFSTAKAEAQTPKAEFPEFDEPPEPTEEEVEQFYESMARAHADGVFDNVTPPPEAEDVYL
jgi:hypothetical protein